MSAIAVPCWAFGPEAQQIHTSIAAVETLRSTERQRTKR